MHMNGSAKWMCCARSIFSMRLLKFTSKAVKLSLTEFGRSVHECIALSLFRVDLPWAIYSCTDLPLSQQEYNIGRCSIQGERACKASLTSSVTQSESTKSIFCAVDTKTFLSYREQRFSHCFMILWHDNSYGV